MIGPFISILLLPQKVIKGEALNGMKTCTMVNVQMTGGMPGGFRFPASRLVFEREKKRFHNPNPFLFE